MANADSIRLRPLSLEALVAAHVDLVHAAALRQVGDSYLADDVTQTVFLLLARKIQQGSIPPDGGKFLGGWLLKVTRYTALTALRGTRRRRLHELASGKRPAHESPGAHDLLLAELLDEALMGLGESDREMIVLRYFHGCTVPQVAAALRVRTNTAAKRIERALEKLRRFFDRRSVETSASALLSWLPLAALRAAPKNLSPRILTAAARAAPAAASTIPLGVILMTLSTKFKVATALAIIALFAIGTYTIVRVSDRTPEAVAPVTPIAAFPGPVSENPLAKTITLTGTVTDAAAKPLAGILVSQGKTPFYGEEHYHRAFTDDAGKFTLVGVAVGDDLDLTAQAPGYAPELIVGVATRNPEPFQIKLQPSKTLRVRVVDARGKPVPNLPFDPMNWRNTEVLRLYRLPTWDGPMTDANGLMTWPNAPADTVIMQAVVLDNSYLRKSFSLVASDQVQTIVIPDPISVKIAADDTDSHAPIPEFTVTYGRGDANGPNYWGDREPEHATGGAYETKITYSFPYYYFRVEAPGYAPVTQKFAEKEPAVSLAFHLSKQSGIVLNVVRPDGKPAAGAPVYVIASTQNFALESTKLFYDPRMPFDAGQTVLTVDADGKAIVPGTDDARTRVVIVDEAGYADVPLQQAANTALLLQPWGRVEGTALVGSQPAAGQQISFSFFSKSEHPIVSGNLTVTSDASGHFVFERVPPVKAGIGRWIETGGASRFSQGTTTNDMQVTVEPGKTIQVIVGGQGRPVVGKIVDAGGAMIKDAIYSLGTITSHIPPSPKPELPAELAPKVAEIQKLPQGEREAQFKAMENTPEVKALEAKAEETRPTINEYSFAVAEDGTFRAEDIAPGEYDLWLEIYSAKTQKPLTSITTTFTVPPMPEGRSDTPLDLGAIKAAATQPAATKPQ